MRKPVYVLGLVGILMSACSESGATHTSAASAGGSFADLLGIGRSIPAEGKTDRVAHADVNFHKGAARITQNRDGQITWAIFDTNKMPKVEKANAESAARAFAKEFADALKIDASELSLSERGIVESKGQVAMAFERKIGDATVEGAFLQMIFVEKDGGLRLAELVNRAYGDTEGLRSNANGTEPVWETVLGFTPKIDSSKAVLFPRMINDKVELIQAVRVELSNPDSGDSYSVIYDASSAALLQAVSHRQSLKVSAEVFERSYFYKDKKVTLPLGGVRINSRNSDADGTTTEEGALRVELRSDVVRVHQNQTTVSFKVNADDDVVATEDDGDISALNAFVAINRISAFVEANMDTSRNRYFSTPISVQVNTSGTCNAFYDGSITLFAAGNGCANMAQVNDVIYHEWGHGLDNFTGTQGGMTDSAFSEGIGDIVAGYYVGDSNMAPGFNVGTERGIRNMENKSTLQNSRGESHKEGTIISGAFWDLRKGMIARYGEQAGKTKAQKLFFEHLQTTDTYQNSYRSVLRANDDDNNPATRSPDHCLITTAFANHGLATEEQNCRDGNIPDEVALDKSLSLLVVSDDTSGVALAAGIEGEKSIVLCLSDAQTCFNDATAKIDLATAASKGSVSVFKTSKNVAITEKTPFTLLAKDKAGKLVGFRTFTLEK